MKDLRDTYLGRVLTAVSRLGNALTGGSYNSSVSGRVGFRAKEYPNLYWLFLEAVIDFTYLPIDGRFHCLRSYQSQDNRELEMGPTWGLVILTQLVWMACGPGMLVTWSYYLLKKLWKSLQAHSPDSPAHSPG